MNIGQSFEMALKSISHNKMRSFLTMLGIIIGVAAVVIMVSIVQGMNDMTIRSIERQGSHQISVNFSSSRKIPGLAEDLYAFCKQHPETFLGVTPDSYDSCAVQYQQVSLQDREIKLATDQFSSVKNYTIVEGRDLTYSDIINRSRVAVIGADTKKQFFNYADAIGKTIRLNGQQVTVVGVYQNKIDPNLESAQWYSDDKVVVIPYTLQRTIFRTEGINRFTVRATSAQAAIDGQKLVRDFLTPYFGNENDFSVYSDQEWMNDMKQQYFIMSLVVGAIAGISLLVGGIGIMNIMLVSVTERTREIGIRKAIGADRLSIVVQFLIEAATVSASGGIIGMVFGTVGTLMIGMMMPTEMTEGMLLYPKVGIMVFAFIFSVFLGIFFGVYPALKASKLNPIDALRSE